MPEGDGPSAPPRWVDGPVVGLDVATPSGRGRSGEGGRLPATVGERATFSLGGLELGSAIVTERMTSADLRGPDVASRVWTARSLNVARLLHSLGDGRSVDPAIQITAAHRDAVSAVRRSLDLDGPPEQFDEQPAVVELLAVLGCTMPSLTRVRNQLRRSLHGVRKLADVEVPLSDGSHLLADVFVPVTGEAVPAVVRLGPYGRAFSMGSACDQTGRDRSERREDRYFEAEGADRLRLGFGESVVSVNAFDWVPRGYAVVRIDARGCGRTPGELSVFSDQEAQDYHEAIEWCAAQDWCDGAVGLAGASYHATNQWAVAARRPPSLRAIIPWAGDVDAYRELAHPGGIFQEGYRDWWWETLVLGGTCSGDVLDTLAQLRAHPFDDESYCSGTPGPVSPAVEAVTVPALIAVSQTATLHARGGFEAFERTGSTHRSLVVVDGHYYPFFYEECLEEQIAFMDRWLRGVPVAEEPPPVRYALRVGEGAYEWDSAETWPPAGASWSRLYLDAAGPGPHVDHDGEPPGRLVPTPPERPAADSYLADPGAGWRTSGASFVSEPLSSPVDVVGPVSCRLFLSATAPDADVFVSVWVLDEDGRKVQYGMGSTASSPMTRGCLKASHRALDPLRSRRSRPVHRHTRSAQQLLRGEEVVALDVELAQTASRLPAGCRIRVDVQPVEGPGGFADPTNAGAEQFPRAYDEGYHAGHVNTLHTGPDAVSFLEFAVLGEVRFDAGAGHAAEPGAASTRARSGGSR
jgi:predicted acyl esterase